MTKSTTSLYDLNSLLRVANVVICGLSIYLYYIKDDNDLVNIFTLFLLGLFAIENIWMLSYEKRRRNPFILILVLVVTVFYMARIATILHIPTSASLFQTAFITTAKDLNYALIFILLSNASMFLGFYIGRKNNIIRKNITFSDDPVPKVHNAIIIIIPCVLVQFFNVLNPEAFGRLTGYVQGIIYNQQIILLFTFTLLAYHYNKISLRIRTLFIVMILAIIILITLSGSRAGVLSMGMFLLMGILAVKQRIMISKKVILICLIMVPISMSFFVTATFKRQLGITKKVSVEHLYLAKEDEIFDFNRIEDYLAAIYYRLAFLDYSTVLIANRQNFAKIINVQYYVESIVDNVLTPGFDVFGTARASYALSYVRIGLPIPHKDQIKEAYQSDQMGIYGEYYVLFYGYPALAVFFFLAFMFQRAFVSFKTTNVLLFCLYRAVLLNLFYIYMNSFGTDWFLLDIVAAVITTFLFARYYVSNRKRKIDLQLESKKDAGTYVCKVI